jgi:hypothetical protein
MNDSRKRYTAYLSVLAALVSGIAASAEHPPGTLEVVQQTVVDSQAWKWNWSSWDQDKIATCGNYQYTVYWDVDRVFVLARRDLCTNQVQTLRFPDWTLSSDDRHRNTCLGISAADGRLHFSWDHHNNQLRYARSRAGFLVDPPERLTRGDIEPARPMLPDPSLETQVTYPRFFNDADGLLYFFYRIGSSGNGDNFLHRYDSDETTWRRLGMLFSKRGTYSPWRNSASRCAYLHDLVFDRTNRLHATWVYRETGASWASNHDLHYAYSDDRGVTWSSNGGETIADLSAGDPIELADAGIVVREIPVYSWVMNAGCMALDGANRPHVVTYRLPETYVPDKLQHGPPEHIRQQECFVHYWRSDDGNWLGGDLIPAGLTGTSRVDVLFDAYNNLYFFYPTVAGFRYFVASAAEQWRDWKGPLPLTDPTLTGRDASKYDRRRWDRQRILSFTAKSSPGGFAILDARLEP